MNACYAAEAAHVSAKLDTLVAQLRQRLDTARGKGLMQTEAIWTKYRDATCKWQADMWEGGSIQPTEYALCVIALTWERIGLLKLHLCEGEGMTGPCSESDAYARPAGGR
jgi:uncharacterized protein YecT (DUF1311 family)